MIMYDHGYTFDNRASTVDIHPVYMKPEKNTTGRPCWLTGRNGPEPPCIRDSGNGGAEGDRTLGLHVANVALSQLSYCPMTLTPISKPQVSKKCNSNVKSPQVPGIQSPGDMTCGTSMYHPLSVFDHSVDRRRRLFRKKSGPSPVIFRVPWVVVPLTVIPATVQRSTVNR